MKKQAQLPRWEQTEQKYNPTPDLTSDAVVYARLSTVKQYVENLQSHREQIELLIKQVKEKLGFSEENTTNQIGKVTLFVENQADDGTIRNASGTWSIDKRPGLQAILDLINSGKVKLVVAFDVARLFRDEDQIDSNTFVRTCKQNGCYVYITSQAMMFNFANPNHVSLFRSFVQMGADYITYHVKGTMLHRRDLASQQGQWAGCGSIPLGFTVDQDKTSRYYKKFIPYEAHAEIWRGYYKRVIELNFNVRQLHTELIKQPFMFPDFEEGSYIGKRSATKVDGGYILSRQALEDGFCNEDHIGDFRGGDDNFIPNNHPGFIDKATFWLVYDRLREFRPDGTPTGRIPRVRYSRNNNNTTSIWKDLMTSTAEGSSVSYHSPDEHNKAGKYRVFTWIRMVESNLLCANANDLETVLLEKLFEKIKQENLDDLSEELAKAAEEGKAQLASIEQKFISLQQETDINLDEISEERQKLAKKGLKTSLVLTRLRAKTTRLEEKYETLSADKARLEVEAAQQEIIGPSLEEIAYVHTAWNDKPLLLRKNLVEGVVKNIYLDHLTPRFYRVQIEWRYGSWGVDSRIMEKHKTGSADWDQEQLAALVALYNDPAKSDEDIKKAFPDRSWSAIRQQAMKHEVRTRPAGNKDPQTSYSWNDLQLMEQAGTTIGDNSLFEWVCADGGRKFDSYYIAQMRHLHTLIKSFLVA